MSRLQELIAELCPDGVEYKTLGEVGVFMRGSSFQKKHFVEDGTPCIHYGQVHTRFNIATEEVVSYLDENFAAKMKRAQPGDLIIATTSEDDDAVGKAIAWLGDMDVVVSNDAYIYRHELDPKYMAYVFASDLFQEPKRQYITGTKVRRLNDKGMSKIVIPVPPIEVQREVVRILDEYTAAHDELVRQLKEEIRLRDSSYSDVRDNMLLGNSDAEVRPFKDFCESMNTGPFGSSVHKTDYVDNGCPIVNPADIRGTSVTAGKMVSEEAEQRLARYKLKANDIVIGRRGEMGRIGIVDEKAEGYLCGTGCFFVRMNGLALPHYWRYLFSTSYSKTYLEAHAVGSTMKNLNLSILGNMPVPVPGLNEQQALISLLDEYSSAQEELSHQLRSEITMLEQQLTLVRNQLLAFPEKC